MFGCTDEEPLDPRQKRVQSLRGRGSRVCPPTPIGVWGIDAQPCMLHPPEVANPSTVPLTMLRSTRTSTTAVLNPSFVAARLARDVFPALLGPSKIAQSPFHSPADQVAEFLVSTVQVPRVALRLRVKVAWQSLAPVSCQQAAKLAPKTAADVPGGPAREDRTPGGPEKCRRRRGRPRRRPPAWRGSPGGRPP